MSKLVHDKFLAYAIIPSFFFVCFGMTLLFLSLASYTDETSVMFGNKKGNTNIALPRMIFVVIGGTCTGFGILYMSIWYYIGPLLAQKEKNEKKSDGEVHAPLWKVLDVVRSKLSIDSASTITSDKIPS